MSSEIKKTVCPLCGKETEYAGMTSYHWCKEEDREDEEYELTPAEQAAFEGTSVYDY